MDIQVLTYLIYRKQPAFWLYSVSHTYQYPFSTSMYAFHGVLLEKRVSQQVILISQEASLTVCDTPACSGVIKVHPRRLCTPDHSTQTPQWKESKTRGERRKWRRTLHSCGARAGGKQPFCHSLGSQLSFYLRKKCSCAFPSAMEKIGGGQSTRSSCHGRGHGSKAG